MALLSDNRTETKKAVPGQERSVRASNPDWDGGQEASFGRTERDSTSAGRYGKPTIDQSFSENVNDDRTLRALGLGTKKDTDLKDSAEQYQDEQIAANEANRAISNAQKTSRLRNRAVNRKASLIATELSPLQVIARTKATAIGGAALSWSFPLWLTFQLPFAIIGIATLGVVGAIDAITTSSGGILGWLASATATVLDTVAKFIGLDFAEIALSIYLISYVLVLAFGILSILFLYLQYTIAGLKPLSGSGSGLKIGMLLLAVIGYATPIANMFPFVLLWVAAVWFYPR